jgi:hypothetical protein
MRKLLTAVFILFICQHAAAQSDRFSVKAGANLFVLRSDNDETKNYSHGKVGFTLGVGYDLKLSKSISIKPEFNYSFQQAEEEYHGSTLKANYIQVPLLFRYHINNGPVVLYAGPQVSFLTSAKTTSGNSPDADVSADLNQTDFGIAWGIATSPNRKGIFFDIRVYNGLMDVYKAEYDNGIQTRPLLVSASIGYLFHKK